MSLLWELIRRKLNLFREKFSDPTQSPALRFLAILEEVGALDLLRQNPQGLTSNEIASSLSLESRIVSSLCEFVSVNLPFILKKYENRFVLGVIPPPILNRVYFMLAYEPVISNLARVMRGEVRYGKEAMREGKYLQRSSAFYNKPAWKIITNSIQESGCNYVVDIGCGSGEFLIYVAETLPHITALGLDHDPETALSASRNVQTARLADRIQIKAADARDLGHIKRAIPPHIVSTKIFITGITIWHEFLIGGDESLRDLWKQYRTYFPKSMWAVVEYDGMSYEELLTLPPKERIRASFYHFVHPITNQGSPRPPTFWKSILFTDVAHLTRVDKLPNHTSVYLGKFT